MAATQCILACTHGEDDLLKFKLSKRMGKKGHFSDSECSIVVGATIVKVKNSQSISETSDVLGFSCTTKSYL